MMVGALRAELLPDSPAANSQFTATSTSTTTWKLKVNGSVSPFEIPGGEGGEQHDHDRQQELPHGPIDFGYPVSPVMLTSALTFGVGLAQLAMATLRLTFLTTYISDPLVSGFTTGINLKIFF
jgi:hypothetical protein